MRYVINFLQLIEKISDFFDKNVKAEVYSLGKNAVAVETVQNDSNESDQDQKINNFDNGIDDTSLKNILTIVIDQKNSVKVKIKKRIFLLSLI